jgi:hypothetical protein
MKAKVNENCIGCGSCIAMCEEVFEFNDNGFAEAKDKELTDEEKEMVNNIILMCPVEAISVEEEKEEKKDNN